LQVVGDPKVCTALLDVIHSLLGKLLGTPTTAEKLAMLVCEFCTVRPLTRFLLNDQKKAGQRKVARCSIIA
jgi:hypothetical protein